MTTKMRKQQGNVIPFDRSGPLEVLPAVNLETIECLEHLLDEARQGNLIGLAFAALFRRRNYTTHACGEVRRDRVFTRGMLRDLDDQLRRGGQ